VTRLSLDYQVTLLLADPRPQSDAVAATLTVESRMTLTVGGSDVSVEPATGENYAACVGLLRRTVTSAGMGPDGTLAIDFDEGLSVVVHPDPRHESWSLSGHGVPHVLVGPS
jgi:hypothetical protein